MPRLRFIIILLGTYFEMIFSHKVESEIWILSEPQNTENPDLTGNNI
jgi:hypothetical protein